MAFDEQINAVANRHAHGPHDRERALFLGRVEEMIRSTKWVELQRGVAHVLHACRSFGKEARIARSLVPAIGIDAQARTLFAAKQLPDRHTKALAENVPACDLN